jgi:hypothetical protein
VRCESKFSSIRPLKVSIEEATYSAMEEISKATQPRVLNTGKGDNSEWVLVEYQWPDDGGYTDNTDDILEPFGLKLVKDWREAPPQDRLR